MHQVADWLNLPAEFRFDRRVDIGAPITDDVFLLFRQRVVGAKGLPVNHGGVGLCPLDDLACRRFMLRITRRREQRRNRTLGKRYRNGLGWLFVRWCRAFAQSEPFDQGSEAAKGTPESSDNMPDGLAM